MAQKSPGRSLAVWWVEFDVNKNLTDLFSRVVLTEGGGGLKTPHARHTAAQGRGGDERVKLRLGHAD